MLSREKLASWLPSSVKALAHYDRRTFLHDALAGVTVGLVALPLAMAFAISSGVSPEAGIYTAVVAGFLISALGGSRVQIGGPTGAFVVVIFGIIARHGLDGLFMCTLMAGALLVLMGLTGMGTAVDFLPRPVVVGFSNGIALLIASTQIKDFFGLKLASVSGVFLPRMIELTHALPTFSATATALAAAAVIVVAVCQRRFRHVPGATVALVAGTLAVRLLHLHVETIGSRFGGIPAGLPPIHIPHFRPEMIHPLLLPAVTVAMLSAIESLMSATVADRMAGDRHNPNVELVAQGLANLASPLVGGIPATGAIARTATNIRSGGRTPVAGMIHSLTLLVVLLVASPLARDVPLAVLAGILLVVAYNMGDWLEVRDILKLSKTDISVWLATFGLTVFADLTAAVTTGMIMAALLAIRKVAVTTSVVEETGEEIEAARVHLLQGRDVPEYAVVYRVLGPLLFGSADKLAEIARRGEGLPPIVILRLRTMTAIDGTGLGALEDLADRLHESGRTLILAGAREQPAQLMAQAEFHDHIGRENICDNVQQALERAARVHAESPTATAGPLTPGRTRE